MGGSEGGGFEVKNGNADQVAMARKTFSDFVSMYTKQSQLKLPVELNGAVIRLFDSINAEDASLKLYKDLQKLAGVFVDLPKEMSQLFSKDHSAILSLQLRGETNEKLKAGEEKILTFLNAYRVRREERKKEMLNNFEGVKKDNNFLKDGKVAKNDDRMVLYDGGGLIKERGVRERIEIPNWYSTLLQRIHKGNTVRLVFRELLINMLTTSRTSSPPPRQFSR